MNEEWERLAQGLLEYETLTGEEIKRVMNGEPPHKDDDEDDTSNDRPSLTAVPKTKPKAKPTEDGGMEPEPS
jgi:cell division protease FtsH